MCPHTAAIAMPPAARATCLPNYCYTCVRHPQPESNAGTALCPLPSALCPLPSALCPMSYALCPLPSAAAVHRYICVLYTAIYVSAYCSMRSWSVAAAGAGGAMSAAIPMYVSCVLRYMCPHTAVCAVGLQLQQAQEELCQQRNSYVCVQYTAMYVSA